MSFRWLLVGEGSLIVVAAVWCWLRGISIPYHLDPHALGMALAATVGFVLVNFSLYHLSKRARSPADLHAFLESELFPIFRGVPAWQLVLLSALAGLGEELLFRGVIQEELGIWIASAVFGVLHWPERALWLLAVWAAAMGVALGLLYQTTGNLLVPALSHALYDGAALLYLSRGETGTENAIFEKG